MTVVCGSASDINATHLAVAEQTVRKRGFGIDPDSVMHRAMLPILRILPVGGVLLAILILVLALSPPDGSRSPMAATIAPARGALVDRDRHPEVRQFLILAALKRADELNRLRVLPDTPAYSDNAQSKVAGLPNDRSDTDPEETVSINETPSASIPVEIGEPSSFELPVTSQEESAPAVRKPEPAKPEREIRRRGAHRARHKVTANATPPHQTTLFEILFGGQQYQQPAYGTQQSNQWYQQQPYAASQATQSAFSTVPRTMPY
jgi:hypothetical protein